MSRWTPKVCSLTLKGLDEPVQATPEVARKAPLPGLEGELAKPEHIQPLQQSISKISNALSQIETEQSYYRRREHRHRNSSSIFIFFDFWFLIHYFLLQLLAAEETCERVQWWSIYETSAIVLISLVQVFILRRWFDAKRATGGV